MKETRKYKLKLTRIATNAADRDSMGDGLLSNKRKADMWYSYIHRNKTTGLTKKQYNNFKRLDRQMKGREREYRDCGGCDK